jgi:NAD(P)H-dependent FMN reductase
MALRLLAFAASLRKGSLNRKLIQVAANLASQLGAEVDFAEFHQFDAPSFNADIMDATGLPPGPGELQRRLAAVDGFLLSSPEYNYSIPGTIKNVIDWISRAKPANPLRGKSAFIMAASGGPIGGIRGLWQLRVPLEGCGVFVNPDMYIVPNGREAFTPEGGLVDQAAQQRLEQMMSGYLRFARALSAPLP